MLAKQSENHSHSKVNLAEYWEKVPRLSKDLITFTEEEACGLWHPYNDAIVVNLRIVGRKVYRILIDNGSSSDILFKSTLNRMDLLGASMKPTKSTLYGFIGESVNAKGILSLSIELGTHLWQHIHIVHFVLVDCPSVYNVIIGRPTLNAIWAIISTYHLLVKFPTIGGIGILQRQQAESHDLYEEASKPSNGSCVNSMIIGSVEFSSNGVEKSSEPRQPCLSSSMTRSSTMTSSKTLDAMTLQALRGTILQALRARLSPKI